MSVGTLTSFRAACFASLWVNTVRLSAKGVWAAENNMRWRYEGIASLPRLQKGPHGEMVGKSQGHQAEEDGATHFEEMSKAFFLVTRDLKDLWKFARL